MVLREKNVAERIALLLERVCDLLGGIAAVIIMLLAVPVIYNAMARDLGHPTTWGFEVTLYALIAGAFLANAQALKHGNHFRMRVLITLFPRAARYFDWVAWGTTLVFGAVIVVAGATFVQYSYVNDIHAPTLLGTPMWIPQSAVPLGGALLMLQSLALLLGRRADRSKPEYVE